MNCLIFSDSHGNSSRMTDVLERQTAPVDVMIHLGDGLTDLRNLPSGIPTVFRVRGNCDLAVLEPAPIQSLASLEGHLLFMTHGYTYGVKSGIETIVKVGVAQGADIILFGHTHRPLLQIFPTGMRIGETELSRPLYLFNPGSISLNNGDERHSFGTLYLDKSTVLFGHGSL